MTMEQTRARCLNGIIRRASQDYTGEWGTDWHLLHCPWPAPATSVYRTLLHLYRTQHSHFVHAPHVAAVSHHVFFFRMNFKHSFRSWSALNNTIFDFRSYAEPRCDELQLYQSRGGTCSMHILFFDHAWTLHFQPTFFGHPWKQK